MSSTYVDSGKLADDITWDLISSFVLRNLGLHLYFIFNRCETMAQDYLVLFFVCLFFFFNLFLWSRPQCVVIKFLRLSSVLTKCAKPLELTGPFVYSMDWKEVERVFKV